MLVCPSEKEEFSCSLMQMDSNKTLGPDGFNLRFYKRYWLDSRQLPPSLHDTNTALVHNKDNPETMMG